MTEQALSGIGSDDSVEREHARQDELLRRIDEEGLVPSSEFSAMVETLARLRELPDHLAWVATRYLQACAARGDKMFTAAQQQTLGVPTSHTVASLTCGCGESVPVDHVRTWRGGRSVEAGTCPACGTDVARFDGEPYPRPTLYSPGFR